MAGTNHAAGCAAVGGRIAGIPPRCLVCGHEDLRRVDVLPAELVAQWQLDAAETAYVNLQQGLNCARCGSTLRCMALAAALLRWIGGSAPFAAATELRRLDDLAVLEINPAGGLSPFLGRLSRHVLATYPSVDMRALPFADQSFDLVVHSDTLEHVAEPVRGLAECRRVLRPGGACLFTVPLVVGRLTRSRAGLPPSFHGAPGAADRYLVHSEFGSDAWREVLAAGFGECRITALAPPAAHAFTAVR